MSVAHITNGKSMSVRLLERKDGKRIYKINHGARTWQAKHLVITDDWLIENEKGAPLDPYGKNGLRIVDACEKYAAAELDG